MSRCACCTRLNFELQDLLELLALDKCGRRMAAEGRFISYYDKVHIGSA